MQIYTVKICKTYNLPALTVNSREIIVPTEFVAAHLYVAQWTSCRNDAASNGGKYNEPLAKMCRTYNCVSSHYNYL